MPNATLLVRKGVSRHAYVQAALDKRPLLKEWYLGQFANRKNFFLRAWTQATGVEMLKKPGGAGMYWPSVLFKFSARRDWVWWMKFLHVQGWLDGTLPPGLHTCQPISRWDLAGAYPTQQLSPGWGCLLLRDEAANVRFEYTVLQGPPHTGASDPMPVFAKLVPEPNAKRYRVKLLNVVKVGARLCNLGGVPCHYLPCHALCAARRQGLHSCRTLAESCGREDAQTESLHACR